jgi:hypothetical protein
VKHDDGGLAFQSNNANTTVAADQDDSINSGASVALTIEAGVTPSNCGAAIYGDPTTWCTTFSGALLNTADTQFCRTTDGNHPTCSTGAACETYIENADAPETFVVKHTEVDGFHYYPIMVTGYSGCNSDTNTLTVLPYPDTRLTAGDTIQFALMDWLHPSIQYGHFIAERILTSVQQTEYIPHSNLGSLADAAGDCTAIAGTDGNAGSSTETLIPFDPTKAAFLGSWSAVHGSACQHDGAQSNILTWPAVTVTPGWYVARIRIGSHDTGATPSVIVIDQGGNTVFIPWQHVVTRGVDVKGNQGLVAQNQIGGWSTVALRFYVSALTTTIRLKADFGSDDGNYWDDYYLYKDIDQTDIIWLDPRPLIPDGTYRALVVSDSRGTTLLGTLFRAAIEEQLPYMRPDLHLTITDDSVSGRQLGDYGDPSCTDDSCWNTASHEAAMKLAHYDYVFAFITVNDFHSVPPSNVSNRMLRTMDMFARAGTQVIWIEEPPIEGNSLFAGNESSAATCFSDDGNKLGCAKSIEQTLRALIYGGHFN